MRGENHENEVYYNTKPTSVNFAILQSVADFQPDVDAIYRLTRTTPLSFERPTPIVIAPVVRRGSKEIKCLIKAYLNSQNSM